MYLINLSQDHSQINPYISSTLLREIEKTLKNKERVILYLNKRGEFSSLICKDCQHLYRCPYCDISLSVHNYPSKIICHICSYQKPVPLKCEKCNGSNLEKIGVGTQQIEKSLDLYFSKEKKIFRFDTDNLKKKSDKLTALEELNNSDIIIGTKMITTGFNISKLGLIGVILLEQELQIPKYNTEENVYSNIKQLIGRGGRVDQKTKILIQSFIPNNSFVKSIVDGNYKDFFINSLKERKAFNYPPFSEMITIEYRHKNENKARDFIDNLANKINIEINKSPIPNPFPLQGKGNKILPPEGGKMSEGHKGERQIEIKKIPNYTKRYNQYFFKIILKGSNLREFIECIRPEIMRNQGLSIIFD